MTDGSRSKIILTAYVLLLLLLASVGHLYYRTTRGLEEDFSFAAFDQAAFPDWAYCDRGFEYVPEWEDCSGCIASFQDRQGRPLNGRQSFKTKVEERKELDGKAEVASLGHMAARAGFIDGVLEGPAQVFFKNGKVALECSYHSGLRDGICRNYASSGQLMSEVEYALGEKTGVYKAYQPGGALLSDGTAESCQQYSIGRKAFKTVSALRAEISCCSPSTKETSDEGPLVRRQEYRMEGKDGALLNVAVMREYFSGTGGSSPIYREMTVDGKLMRQETFIWDLNVVQDFNRAGMLRRELQYRHGLLNGTARWYDGKEHLRREGTNRNGLADGLFQWYDRDGRVIWRALYAKGRLAGERTFYSFLSWAIFGVVLLIVFSAFFPVYAGLRQRIKMKALSYLIAALVAGALVPVCAWLAFMIMTLFYS